MVGGGLHLKEPPHLATEGCELFGPQPSLVLPIVSIVVPFWGYVLGSLV